MSCQSSGAFSSRGDKRCPARGQDPLRRAQAPGTTTLLTVYCSYATTGGHALVGTRIYLPEDQLADVARRDAAGVPEDVTFRAKPQLAQDILTGMIADDTMPPWVAGDEVCGRSGPLRKFFQDNGIGYVMGVGCAFRAVGGSAR